MEVSRKETLRNLLDTATGDDLVRVRHELITLLRAEQGSAVRRARLAGMEVHRGS